MRRFYVLKLWSKLLRGWNSGVKGFGMEIVSILRCTLAISRYYSAARSSLDKIKTLCREVDGGDRNPKTVPHRTLSGQSAVFYRSATGITAAAVHPGAGEASGASGAGGAAPAQAWSEREQAERADSPGEERRLLTPVHAAQHKPKPHRSRLQAGLTLGVWPISKKNSKPAPSQKLEKPPAKTKYEKRKEKIIAALRPPYFILSMIAIITAIQMWGSDEVRFALEWSPSAWRRQPWRLVTYGWVHAGGAHAALNALVALAVGWRLEREQGWWRAAALWTGGVAAGALGAGALQPTVRVVGASAAVYALLTAHLPNVCLRFGYIPLWWFRPLSVVVLAASEATWTLLVAPPGSAAAEAASSQGHVAWAAHVFGAFIGVPLAFLVFTGENIEKRHVVWCRAVSLALLAASGATATLYYLHCQHQHLLRV
ncbi:rhomboid family domain-containing protein [Phthorimaea operculella]|nr:rhomboid family domain-containing protein [Phthorimaea operculella]